ncbi:dnaJ homolog subfamily C member 24 isoform X2 [Strix aluco]|uniref:dnaJ homolog subfamily C member 24 isoform X2 n=1 Tax=Strix aluco TaxID=111821 RepID=UPI003DA504BD
MAFERITQKDWYKILGAKPSDSPAELKRKYQKLALLYHPDKQKADVPAGEVEECVQRFIEIDQAWKILGNEETKKEYDLQQREDNLTKEWPLHAQIYLEDMSWNEGAYYNAKQCSDLPDANSPAATRITNHTSNYCHFEELSQQYAKRRSMNYYERKIF